MNFAGHQRTGLPMTVDNLDQVDLVHSRTLGHLRLLVRQQAAPIALDRGELSHMGADISASLTLPQVGISSPSISRPTRASNNVWMDVKANRLANLRALIERRAQGNVAKFAEEYDLDAVYLRQILSGWQNRKPGDEMSRRIEKRLGLPQFWMDEGHGEEPDKIELPEPAAERLPEPLSRLHEVWATLSPDEVKVVASMADSFYNRTRKMTERKRGQR